jgi:hypothetical protein
MMTYFVKIDKKCLNGALNCVKSMQNYVNTLFSKYAMLIRVPL